MKPNKPLHKLSTVALKHELNQQQKLVSNTPLNSPSFKASLKRLAEIQNEWQSRINAMKHPPNAS